MALENISSLRFLLSDFKSWTNMSPINVRGCFDELWVRTGPELSLATKKNRGWRERLLVSKQLVWSGLLTAPPPQRFRVDTSVWGVLATLWAGLLLCRRFISPLGSIISVSADYLAPMMSPGWQGNVGKETTQLRENEGSHSSNILFCLLISSCFQRKSPQKEGYPVNVAGSPPTWYCPLPKSSSEASAIPTDHCKDPKTRLCIPFVPGPAFPLLYYVGFYII